MHFSSYFPYYIIITISDKNKKVNKKEEKNRKKFIYATVSNTIALRRNNS
jgi:hypothetical protein